MVSVALLCLVISVYGVPDMVSSIYYLLGRRGWMFQLAMVVLGIVMMACLLDSGLGEPCLAFIACGGFLNGRRCCRDSFRCWIPPCRSSEDTV